MKIRFLFTSILCIGIFSQLIAQNAKIYTTADGKTFTVQKQIPATTVKDQGNSGTCWSYAAVSFLESELIRLGKEETDLSEMFIVRYAYLDKADRYIRLEGKAQFSQGGQAHDVLNIMKKEGIVLQKDFIGAADGSLIPDHSKLEKKLKHFVSDQVRLPHPDLDWKLKYSSVLDSFMGKLPDKSGLNNNRQTPVEFFTNLGINPENYIEITSYSHHPYYAWFDLEIPDNWSHDHYFNVPLKDLVSIADDAIKNGFSVCWDGDVSEPLFKHGKGYAVLGNDDAEISDKDRQLTFDTLSTTDDHLIHIMGIAHDQNGKKYYMIKNSWGESNSFGGYLFMSEAYFKLKTVAILVNKDALNVDLRKKIQ